MRAREFIIHVDAREKKPLPFAPRYTMLDRSRRPHERCSFVAHIRTESVTLKTADYVLAGEAGVCYAVPHVAARAVVERKAGLDEIAANCLDLHKRALFIAALKRMRESWAHPVVLFEGGVDRLLTPTSNNPCAGLAADALFDLSHEYGVPIVPAGGDSLHQRRLLAEYVVRYLVSGVLSHAHPDQHSTPNDPQPQ